MAEVELFGRFEFMVTIRIAAVLGMLLMTELAVAKKFDQAKEFFDSLNKSNLEMVDKFYDKNAVFQDPIHTLNGSESIKAYYAGLYKNVESIRFEYGKSIESADTVSFTWKMILKAPALDKNELTVEGSSFVTFGGSEGKAVWHRDYFDMGEFVYERIPILKSIIGYIKGRFSKH